MCIRDRSHTVPEKERMLHFDRLNWQELIVGEPEYEKEYFPDRYLVTGHTPVSYTHLPTVL